MALLETPSANNDFTAPDFTLKNIDGQMMGYSDIKGENGTLLLFICNHCPYVKAIIGRLVADCKALQDKGIGIAAIMPNDTDNYPKDSFDNMKIFAKDNGFTFPYLIDETQDIAKAYDAVCTPDLFGFNAQSVLKYRGRCDSAGPKPADSTTIRELLNAMSDIAQTGQSPAKQFPSIGCSIKWKS